MQKLLNFRQLFVVVVIWRVALFLIALAAPLFIRFKSSFVDAEMLAASALPHWISAWANFDGVHYLTLATRGYLAVGLIQAFFPTLPLLLQSIWSITSNLAVLIVAGQALSFVCLALVLYLYSPLLKHYALVQVRAQYRWLILLLLLFPTAFYFAAVYTESLFLALALGAFVATAHKRWWLAGSLAAVASGTRVVGIVLVPALLIELALQTGLWSGRVRSTGNNLARWLNTQKMNVLAISTGTIGLLLYSTYLWYHFNDPFYFFHVQSEFGGGRQETLILFPQVGWRYLKILATVPLDLRYLIYLEEFFAAVGGVAVLAFGYKKVRPSLWFFSLAVLLIPPLTGTFSSMARYVLVAPAIFIILNAWLAKYPRVRIIWLVASAVLLVVNTILFIQGYWVA